MKKRLIIFFLMLHQGIYAQLPPVFDSKQAAAAQTTPTIRKYLSPVRVVWQAGDIQNTAALLRTGNGQADLAGKNICTLKPSGTTKPAILLDFGKELQGGIQIVTGMTAGNKAVKIRIRLGESVSEAMSDIEPEKNATNDHAMRDMIVQVPWLGKLEIGNSGFRFVRIDVIDEVPAFLLQEVRAIFNYRDIPYLGSFHCSDTLLNKIWMTGAYTVHLNMQDYLWDGIKRDRLVWVGDMHPEIASINAVFGYNDVVPRSLDLVRDITPLPGWMNGISTYSMWWVIIHHDWYLHQGNLAYLQQQKAYLLPLLRQIMQHIDENNSEKLDGRFLDWPSSENPAGIHAGLQAMMVLCLQSGADLCKTLKEPAVAAECEAAVARLKKHVPDVAGSKQAAALLSLSGLAPAEKMDKEVLSVNGAHGFSTFYGYYMLSAMARSGNYQGALDAIRSYWGAMLQLGATTFWEDFNLDWMDKAGRIDALLQPGEKDIHGDYGAYCYKGFRHSLCHGWASGPTPWLTEYVLGISVKAPGCKVISITPHLGDLEFASGTFPTPYGVVKVQHVKQPNGKVKTTWNAPKEVKVILQ
ncbi:alpha-L-rhamnosidase C-terminal domain-containing protein [Chitinophaga sp. MM2321]|uniref:alpha-L-rhamnosidase-related protein n=1 Tax=Chitinophaga sp. MM2321 TaxID=3137178 RepID=UPI0032D5836C